MSSFVHLHNHSHFSLLDAAVKPESLVLAAKADGQTAIALTDHGVMFGCFEFYNKAKIHGVKPIIGCEVYLAVGNRFEKKVIQEATKKRTYYHLVLLARNLEGYRNLMKLTTLAHTEGYYYKPRIDWELLERHSTGLIATSACLSGPINAPLLAGDRVTAVSNAKRLKDIFGDDFYVELQNHGLPEDKVVIEQAPGIAAEIGVRIVVTNDTHYLAKDHAYAHNVLLNINKDLSAQKTGSFDPTNLRYRVPEMYLKTQAEMTKLFKAFPQGIDSTMEIAEKVDLTIPSDLMMPAFVIPPDSQAASLEDYLEELTMDGVQKRYSTISSEVLDRVGYELSVINKMGFAGYFLIVHDVIDAARKMGVRVGPGRGSVAGSLVAYALRITDLDPLKYDLLFERFLNPERVSMPDIDIDFADDKRESVIAYVREKYGSDAVAQIITFGTLSSRAVIKDVGRVLGIELSLINSITEKIPLIRGKITPLKKALELPELRWLRDSDDLRLQQLIEYSLVLEGFARNSSLHAAGVVIAPGPVSDYVPLYKTPSMGLATQYTMKDLEAAGLLKMDFLGLRTLSIIENTLEQIRSNHKLILNLDEIPFDDVSVYDLFARGHTVAIFQFESSGMQNYLRQLKPTCLDDLIAMNALYRPGPMDNIPEFIRRKHGESSSEYLHPLLEGILRPTYGVFVYQEQVMQVVRDIAGFSLSQADIFRKAMGKKSAELMREQESQFVEGAAAHINMSPILAREIFATIYKFAEYGFNKSHSAAYAYLAYQTAWLKVHYPAEYLAANMSAELNDREKIVTLIDEARRFGVAVTAPDVNTSQTTFVARDSKIYFGLAGIKHVGVSAIDEILKARADKPFTSIFDLSARVDPKVMNRRTLEALIYAGAFDTVHHGNRSILIESIDTVLSYARARRGSESNGMASLFGEQDNTAIAEPVLPLDVRMAMTTSERLAREREYLNFYVSGHPLDEFAVAVKSLSSFTLNNPEASWNNQRIMMCGMVTDLKQRIDKKEMAFATFRLEQFQGSCDCVVWSDRYSQYANLLSNDTVIVTLGMARIDGDSIRITVDEILPLMSAIERFVRGYVIRLSPDTDRETIELAYGLCNTDDASGIIEFHVADNGRTVVYNTPVKIRTGKDSTQRLVEIFGDNCVRYAIG